MLGDSMEGQSQDHWNLEEEETYGQGDCGNAEFLAIGAGIRS